MIALSKFHCRFRITPFSTARFATNRLPTQPDSASYHWVGKNIYFSVSVPTYHPLQSRHPGVFQDFGAPNTGKCRRACHESNLKKKFYINLPKVMVELGFMSQEEYDNSCAEFIGVVYGCANADLLYFVSFCGYSVSPNGLGLIQIKVDPCIFFSDFRKICTDQL